jgi:hydrogenase maturation protein HypF
MGRLLRQRFRVLGRVQGVGYRPFVCRLALSLNLKGFIKNTKNYVHIEVEGAEDVVDRFRLELLRDAPSQAQIDHLESISVALENDGSFKILSSVEDGSDFGEITPDIAVCSSCIDEVLDPNNRRYRYALNSCAQCGPRYSIIDSLPYDRSNTSMHQFLLCRACDIEYQDPGNRRFHAQTISCHECGPRLSLFDHAGHLVVQDRDALVQMVEALRRGAIVAVKGVGGFQLCVDARSDEAVLELRRRKQRKSKPFAVMYSAISAVKEVCFISEQEEVLLSAAERPIVLVKLKSQQLSKFLAPGLAWLGVMLPAMPLHYLLLQELGFPIVVTSANVSDQPIISDDNLAFSQLRGIADYFLTHNREILWPIDDSVVRVVCDRKLILRRARGYAPGYFKVSNLRAGILGSGGYLKNTISYSDNNLLFLGPYIGDLVAPEARDRHELQVKKLTRKQEAAVTYAADLHPDFIASAHFQPASSQKNIQHHVAHIVSCLVDNELLPPVLGVAWDGAGFGDDGRLWGGEFIKISLNSWRRVAHMRVFSLPGGVQAFKEPCRAALGLLYEIYGEDLFLNSNLIPLGEFSDLEKTNLLQMLQRNIQTYHTTSIGRIFDAFSAILGICQRVSYEGQAAAMLESLAHEARVPRTYACTLVKSLDEMLVVDWEPVVRQVLIDLENGHDLAEIAAGIHFALAQAVVSVAYELQEHHVALSGGCFQNAYLTQAVVKSLQLGGFSPFWHESIPPNDGGLAVGQAVWAAWGAQ